MGNYINRKEYINKLLSYQDKDLIKVVSGLRRSGKSTLLEIYSEHLLGQGIGVKQIQFYKQQLESSKQMKAVAEQNYNYAIKDMFAASGLKRLVTVINPTTGEEEKRPLNEIASSHLARRTFIGNLYKKVKDPNLVGALSGHKEGSKAFARYRDIDDEMKNDLIKMLE